MNRKKEKEYKSYFREAKAIGIFVIAIAVLIWCYMFFIAAPKSETIEEMDVTVWRIHYPNDNAHVSEYTELEIVSTIDGQDALFQFVVKSSEIDRMFAELPHKLVHIKCYKNPLPNNYTVTELSYNGEIISQLENGGGIDMGQKTVLVLGLAAVGAVTIVMFEYLARKDECDFKEKKGMHAEYNYDDDFDD